MLLNWIPISTRTHGGIKVFHGNVANFVHFEDFNRPRLQEGEPVHDVCMG